MKGGRAERRPRRPGSITAPRVAVPAGQRRGGRARRAWPVEVFALDDTSVQLTWRGAPAEGLRLQVGDVVARPEPTPKVPIILDKLGALRYHQFLLARGEAEGPGPVPGEGRARDGWRLLDPALASGPGAVVLDGLEPGQRYDVVASAQGVPAFVAARARTLVSPEGKELARFATVSDVHIGERHFGALGRLQDLQFLDLPREQASYFPFRALAGALEEAAAWGAQRMVVKGDLTRMAKAAEVRDVAKLLAHGPLAVEALLGNHDNVSGANTRALLASQGLTVPWGPRAVDLPGLRLVLVDSVHSHLASHHGELRTANMARLVELVAEAPGPSWVGLHHPPELHRFPLAYPPGIPYAQSKALLEALAATGKPVVLSGGHRHRNRLSGHRPVIVGEVGSTKDYPGGWAAYKVYEGGLVQAVRRTSRPDVITWTEITRRAVNGQWGRWSPGRLADRCFSVSWA